MSFFDKLKVGLGKTKSNINEKFNNVFSNFRKVDEELLENLKNIVGFKMPVVALTADVIAGMEDKYISQGFDDCLAKPIVEEQLYYMLKKYCKEGNNPVPVVEQPVVVEPAEVTIPTPIVEETPVVEAQPVVETQPQEQPAQPSVQIVPGEPHTVELLKNNNIDVDAGIELLKDMEMYNMTLEEFYNELQNKLTDLENYKNEGNMDDYAILAHALKTEARYVGCNELGDIAYEHELASKEKNKEKKVCEKVPAEKSIDYRPEEANTREVYGHWEGDLVIGKRKKGSGSNYSN